jgi:cytochrome b involved in lipid metabolism
MGKGGENIQKENGSNDSSHHQPPSPRKEVFIGGRMYDVARFKHPGGRIINYYAGRGIDATQAFQSFHLRSKKARKYLDSLPSRPADAEEVERNLLPGQKELLADFELLHRQLEAEGLFKPSIPHVVYRHGLARLAKADFCFLIAFQGEMADAMGFSVE